MKAKAQQILDMNIPKTAVAEYFTKKTIAQFFGVSEKTIQRWTKAGMPHLRQGRILRYRKEDVNGWILAGGMSQVKG